MATRKGGLGKGLDALFVENTAENGNSSVTVRITELEPNRNQPRKVFDQTALEELANSIKEVGVIQPLIVRPIADGGYQIVAGERRWRAAQLAGIDMLPVVIRELSDREVAEIALIENLQREDLDAIEEAEGYKSLMDEYALTQDQVAQRVGKSRSAVANAVRLLDLPEKIVEMVQDKMLTAGHARALLALPTQDDMIRVGTIAVRKKMSVRELEKAVKKEKSDGTERKKKESQRSSLLDEVELSLSEELQRRVKVSGTDTHGTLEVDFFSPQELMDIAQRLAGLK